MDIPELAREACASLDAGSFAVLADALEEAGRAGAARRLRSRYRRYGRRRDRLLADTNAWLGDMRRHLDELQRFVHASGGTMTYAVECVERGQEDALLREYVEKLLAEE